MVTCTQSKPVELSKYPYPYQAAFTVASDIDSASSVRFRSVHALFCETGLIQEESPEWKALGLTTDCCRFDKERRGVPGLGLDFADSFFLVGDPTTFGMYRYWPKEGGFREDEQEDNCAGLIRRGIKNGSIDSYHTFLGYERRAIEPLLTSLFTWCEQENALKPQVWINHSRPSAPTGLCPGRLQPSRFKALARLTARKIAGPMLGREHRSLRSAFARYHGDDPSSPYYVNDLLAANGLRYVWLNADSFYCNRIALPENVQNGRSTILDPVEMDDGIRYYQFKRCYGVAPERTNGGIAYLRDSEDGFDASVLINEKNLEELCACNGTTIFYTHWTHWRSLPIADITIKRFELLQRWRDAGKIWVTSTARLLDWTRRRTFLKIHCQHLDSKLTVEIEGVDDPVFGHEPVDLMSLHGLCLRLQRPELDLQIVVNDRVLNPGQFHRMGGLCWLDAGSQHTGGELSSQPTHDVIEARE